MLYAAIHPEHASFIIITMYEYILCIPILYLLEIVSFKLRRFKKINIYNMLFLLKRCHKLITLHTSEQS